MNKAIRYNINRELINTNHLDLTDIRELYPTIIM